MSLPMVKEAGVPDKSDARPGLAHFAGSGPAGKACADCVSRGYYRQSQSSDNTYRYQGCAKFKSMTGRSGPEVRPDNRACKYFEPKPK